MENKKQKFMKQWKVVMFGFRVLTYLSALVLAWYWFGWRMAVLLFVYHCCTGRDLNPKK
jgi:hypothetical protein